MSPTAKADCLPTPVLSVEVSSSETARENGAGANAIDGDPATNWVTRWSSEHDVGHHTLTLRLADEAMVCGLRVRARSDGAGGTIADYVVWTSEDCGTWSGVASGDALFSGWAPSRLVELAWPARSARCVRIASHRDVQGGQYASAAEVEVLTEQAGAPLASTRISWGEVATATSYRVEQSVEGGPWAPIEAIPEPGPCSDDPEDSCGESAAGECVGLVIDGLSLGVRYSWRTIASNAAGDSPPSCVLSWTPAAPDPILPPIAPEHLRRGDAVLSWRTGRWGDLLAWYPCERVCGGTP